MACILRHSLRRIVPAITPNVTSKATVIGGPPKFPMSATEKLFLGGGVCIAIVSPMLWILANIKHYKNPRGIVKNE